MTIGDDERPILQCAREGCTCQDVVACHGRRSRPMHDILPSLLSSPFIPCSSLIVFSPPCHRAFRTCSTTFRQLRLLELRRWVTKHVFPHVYVKRSRSILLYVPRTTMFHFAAAQPHTNATALMCDVPHLTASPLPTR